MAKPKKKPAPKKAKRPSPSFLGIGAASKAAKALKERQKRMEKYG